MRTNAARPPAQDGAWRYEVTFDGYRMQLHKAGGAIGLFTRNGADRFPNLAAARRALMAARVIGGMGLAGDRMFNLKGNSSHRVRRSLRCGLHRRFAR